MNISEYNRVGAKLLRGLIVDSNGQAFQDLFWKIASLAYKNFEKVKPHGSNGDEKNDGYRVGEGVFYQVYSPEKPKETISKGIKKMITDFKGLYTFWNEIETIKEFNFVFNDKFIGSYPEFQEALAKLSKQYPLIKFYLFKADNLLSLYRELIPEKQMEVNDIDCDDAILSFEALNKVSLYLKSISIDDEKVAKLVAPDFEQKIIFNHLSAHLASWLKKHYEYVSQVEKYFAESDDKNLKHELQEKLTHLYNSAVKKFGPPSNEEVSDNIFMEILSCSSTHSLSDPSTRRAALSLMSLYFETCDIFEEPA